MRVRQSIKSSVRAAGDAAASERLTLKQRLFCYAYAATGNATRSAETAGYRGDEPTLGQIGHENLRKPEVARFLARLFERRVTAADLSVERLELELARLTQLDPARAYDAEGRLLHPKDMPEDVRRCLAAHEEEALFEREPVGTGPRGGVLYGKVQVGVTRKVKWHDKVQAIQLGLRRRGALIDKVALEVPAAADVVINGRRQLEERVAEPSSVDSSASQPPEEPESDR